MTVLMFAAVLAAPIVIAWGWCRATRAWAELIVEADRRRDNARAFAATQERVELWRRQWEEQEARESRAFREVLELQAAYHMPCAPNPRLRYVNGTTERRLAAQRRRDRRWREEHR